MHNLYCNIDYIKEDLQLLLNLFGEYKKDLEVTFEMHALSACITINGQPQEYKLDVSNNRQLKHTSKIALYNALSKFTSIKLPWGALTGIRPTKLYYELLKDNDDKTCAKIFTNTYKVSPNKTKLTRLIIKNQHKITPNDDYIDYFIFIPFCPSKCYYCSFVSMPLNNCKHLVTPYLDALKQEIIASKEIIAKNHYIVRNIYIGGGTPTSITYEQLEQIISLLDDVDRNEFTVECGRPDTIDKAKLDMLSRHNVTRISINPQSFNDNTLQKIGRKHTSKDIINAYNLAKNYNFVINMDLIAGLSNETLKDFKHSLNTTISLAPDNITVHTLSIKRASSLKMDGGETSDIDTVKQMVKYSIAKLIHHKYKPYYLYKQKNMLGNLENVGYYKNNICEFNVNSMEECASVLAVGSNAISKRLFSKTNRIERLANVKNISDYIFNIKTIIDKKKIFFDRNNTLQDW